MLGLVRYVYRHGVARCLDWYVVWRPGWLGVGIVRCVYRPVVVRCWDSYVVFIGLVWLGNEIGTLFLLA